MIKKLRLASLFLIARALFSGLMVAGRKRKRAAIEAARYIHGFNLALKLRSLTPTLSHSERDMRS